MLRDALGRADLSLDQLWLRYFAVGGSAGQIELEAYLEDLMPLAATERDMLAIAVNERLDELMWPHRVPYANSVHEPLPISGPLTALADLLETARNSPSEHLPTLAARAGRALGIDINIYLVDDDQRTLVPVTPRASDSVANPPPMPLPIEATLAGQAFRQVTTTISDTDGAAKLWVPLVDDTERLGVLEVILDSAQQTHDPALRQHCEWLAALLAHLITLANRYGDRLDAHRRNHPRTPAADLIRTLVPPTSAAVPGVTLAAATEPSDKAGGDAYDYALSATTAHLALFDAMGSDFNAGLIAATVLASSRAARRDGRDLHEQASAVDQLLADTFGAGTFATGILAELDLTNGVLRYLSAGHPTPLLLRDRKVVKRLADGRRAPFGLDNPEANIAEANTSEEQLQPGDWIVLHTDGVTEARHPNGTLFGDQHLTDFLEREAATQHAAPETVRRLIHAVLEHQHGRLDDDATVLLARWQPPPPRQPNQ